MKKLHIISKKFISLTILFFIFFGLSATNLHAGDVDITNDSVKVDYGVNKYTIGGTNSINIVGVMWWTNSLNGDNGTLAAATSWTIGSIKLSFGDNVINVTGTNKYGSKSDDTITITRGDPLTYPVIVITNAPANIPYSESTAQIAGTNDNMAGDFGWLDDDEGKTNWFNPYLGVANTFKVTVTGLEVGDNVIQVVGTNFAGMWTSDSVTIERKANPGSAPYVVITNAPATIPYSTSTAIISGTNTFLNFLYWVDDNETTNLYETLPDNAFEITVTGLETGPNIIQILGRTFGGGWVSDSVTIYRANNTLTNSVVIITNAPATIPYSASTAVISGTNTPLNILYWVDDKEATNWYEVAPDNAFEITVTGLEKGPNVIQIIGRSFDSGWASDSVTIVRESGGAPSTDPVINITNEPATVSYTESTADISGTNMNIAGNLGWMNNDVGITNWLNPSPGAVNAFEVTVTGLEIGNNVIQVVGTNSHGVWTSDSITIKREDDGGNPHIVVITNAPATIPYSASKAVIYGTNTFMVFLYWVSLQFLVCHLVEQELSFETLLHNSLLHILLRHR